MAVIIPELSLVVLSGPSGSGKSTFARRHFALTEVLSSDFCRALVSDDENAQHATTDAFDVLKYIATKRLAAGRLTVIDATNVKPEDRKPLIALAREFHFLPVAVVFNLPEKVCQERNAQRADRNFGPHVIRNQRAALRQGLRGLKREGFRHVFVFDTPEEVEQVTVERQPLWNNKKNEPGPFDIIGDVHGCYDELVELLGTLGYRVEAADDDAKPAVVPPAGRKAVFLGDLVDRGPGVVAVLRLVMGMVRAGTAYCVPGNHEAKLLRKLRGKDVKLTHGLAETVRQLESEPVEFRREVAEFIDSLVSHYAFDDGRLVVAHAGMREEMQGRGSGRVREFALYGETTGETDEFGLPVRFNWAAEYRGRAMVVYGHTPVPRPEWLNRTINIDTGCVFGGALTALRYPEKEFVSVPARQIYAEPRKPFLSDEAQDALSAQQAHDDLLDIADVTGKRVISTRLMRNLTVSAEQAAAALEVMSRFAVNPKWLIYLPPTMSPCETSQRLDYLEHPDEAFAYFRKHDVSRVICEEKHMGSRAVVIVCRDEEAVRRRFGIDGDGCGIIYTRTGRRFFDDRQLEADVHAALRDALTRAQFWTEFNTDWVCLDCELMPWSVKAQALIQEQYAPVGAAARHGLQASLVALETASANGRAVSDLLMRARAELDCAEKYTQAYGRYCWPVGSASDVRLAPFHLLATEGKVHVDRDHLWHMEVLSRICANQNGLLHLTDHQVIDLSQDQDVEGATNWWADLTGRGGEGMVVKPLDFVTRGRRDWVQPAVKCRGREYLRIIYGPAYTRPENLERLRSRGLARKRSLALREFALGVEALERFVRGEPLRHVHECVFAVLALESEPVDPAL